MNAAERLASALNREANELTRAMEQTADWAMWTLLREDRARVLDRIRGLGSERRAAA
jgi:hypothetical protein